MDQKRIDELKVRIAKFPQNVLDRFVLSKLYYEAGAWQETIQESQEILKLKADYLVVYVQLGDALIKVGKKEEAKEILQKGLQLAIDQRHQGPKEEIERLIKGN